MKDVNPAWSSNKFDKKFLNTLKDDINSGVLIQKIQHHLSLHPIHLHNLTQSVKDCLNEGLAKYNKSTDGIILGYQNVKILSDRGLIVNDSCYIHIDLSLEFFIFKPEIGKEMSGVVNKKSKSHIGILVYDTFNVSIPKPKNAESWLGNDISIGQEVSFKISRINLLSYLPYIEGELSSDELSLNQLKGKHSELVFSDESSDETPKKKSKKTKKHDFEESPTKKSKKRKKDFIGAEVKDSFEADMINFLMKQTSNKKRKTKEMDDNDDVDLDEIVLDDNNTFQKELKKAKSKKLRLSKEIDSEVSQLSNVEPIAHKKKSKNKDEVEEASRDIKKKSKKKKSKQKNDESFSDFYLTQLFEDGN